MSYIQDDLIAWVGSHILPHEGYVRSWLRHASISTTESDDIIQEAFSRLSSLSGYQQIANPRAYFLQVARNILFEQLRRARIVNIETIAEIEFLDIQDDAPSQERNAISRQEMARLRGLIETLPDRCRQVFVLRKIEGLSQRAIAQQLGITENTVETQIRRGLKIILSSWPEEDLGERQRRATRPRRASHEQ